jgi:peroxiredoxin
MSNIACSLTPPRVKLSTHKPPAWMAKVLLAAAVYNLVFGALAVLFPVPFFTLLGAAPPNYPELWQCVGMIVGVYGVGYAAASLAPYRHWPIVLVGLLGKIFGPIGFIYAVIKGTFPLSFGAVILTNDLIWLVPFYLMLQGTYNAYQNEAKLEIAAFTAQRQSILAETETVSGQPLLALCQDKPVLLVLLRHSGCTFCRETLDDLAKALPMLEADGLTPILVHMSAPEDGQAFLEAFKLGQLQHISDPSARLYRSLGLGRGKFAQVLGLKVLQRGLQAKAYGVGALDGDGFQLSGYAVLQAGEVCLAYAHQHAGEKTPFAQLAGHYGSKVTHLP